MEKDAEYAHTLFAVLYLSEYLLKDVKTDSFI